MLFRCNFYTFVRKNSRKAFIKTASSRSELPDYCERSVFESLVNALIHRDYLLSGTEVHIDMFDDRLVITSPGGMVDGTKIQEREINSVASIRRNDVLADIFDRLGYMEREGSGLSKICSEYKKAINYQASMEPIFNSTLSTFSVTLFNLNYKKMDTIAASIDLFSSPNDSLTELQQKILKNLKLHPNLTIDGLSNSLYRSKSSIKVAIKLLQNKRLLERIGAKKNGYWRVKDN